MQLWVDYAAVDGLCSCEWRHAGVGGHAAVDGGNQV